MGAIIAAFMILEVACMGAEVFTVRGEVCTLGAAAVLKTLEEACTRALGVFTRVVRVMRAVDREANIPVKLGELWDLFLWIFRQHHQNETMTQGRRRRRRRRRRRQRRQS